MKHHGCCLIGHFPPLFDTKISCNLQLHLLRLECPGRTAVTLPARWQFMMVLFLYFSCLNRWGDAAPCYELPHECTVYLCVLPLVIHQTLYSWLKTFIMDLIRLDLLCSSDHPISQYLWIFICPHPSGSHEVQGFVGCSAGLLVIKNKTPV